MNRASLTVLGSILVLPLAIACSSSDGDAEPGTGGRNGGPPAQTPVGQELEALAQVADQVIGSNEEAYEGLAFATEALESVFGAQLPTASLKQNGGCIPPELQDSTFEYDPPSQTYGSMQVPGAPPGGLRIFIYDVSSGSPDVTSNIGYLDVTCSGALPNFNMIATLNVNSVDVLSVSANVNIFDSSSYQVTVSGFLADSTATQRIDFDPVQSGGSFSGFETSFTSNFGVEFLVGARTYAVLTRFLSVDTLEPSFNQEDLLINVRKEGDSEFSIYDFEFMALVGATGGGTLSGPGTFFLLPELGGGGGSDAVACFEGTFENMNVSAATESCALGYEIIPLPPEDIAAIERAYQGLQGMYSGVEGVTTTAARIALAALSTGLGSGSCGADTGCTPEAPSICGTNCQTECGGFENFDTAFCGEDNRCVCYCLSGVCTQF